MTFVSGASKSGRPSVSTGPKEGGATSAVERTFEGESRDLGGVFGVLFGDSEGCLGWSLAPIGDNIPGIGFTKSVEIGMWGILIVLGNHRKESLLYSSSRRCGCIGLLHVNV